MDPRGTGLKSTLLRLGLLLSIGSCLATMRGCQLSADPAFSFLSYDGNADWIVFRRPFKLGASFTAETSTKFRKRFATTTLMTDTAITLRAMRKFTAHLDGEPIGAGGGVDADWRAPTVLRIPSIPPGVHVLSITVENWSSPPALVAHSDRLGLQTDDSWEASSAGPSWTPARRADEAQRVNRFDHFPTTIQALGIVIPWLLPLFVLVLLWTYEPRVVREKLPGWVRELPSPARIRWLLVGLWVLLAINNLPKILTNVGFDLDGHIEYISWIRDRLSLPLATDGWQTFQAPLYYLLSAPLMELLSWFLERENVIKGLRILPMACGVVQIEVIFRVARIVFPQRHALQRVALAVGSLMPMHIYMSQSIGNEPLAAMLTSLLFLLVLRLLESPGTIAPWRDYVLIGLAWGSAVLAKTTAVLMAPALLLVAVVHVGAMRTSVRRWFPRVATVAAVTIAVAGWYYLRNWIELGKPFVGGWDPMRGIEWWQDPGYRTWSQLLTFGEALRQPVFAATVGWWDGLHSTMWADGFMSAQLGLSRLPPWNPALMIAGSAFGLVPAALIVIGVWRAVVSASARPLLPLVLAVVCLGTYLGVMLDLFVRLPIYSTAKASYMLGLLPCFAILAAAGFEPLRERRAARAIGSALLVCWAGVAYAAYWG